jgi:hypothetical protein
MGSATQHMGHRRGLCAPREGRQLATPCWALVVAAQFLARQQAAVTAAGWCGCRLYLVCNAVHMLYWHHLARPYRAWHAGVESRLPGEAVGLGWVFRLMLCWCVGAAAAQPASAMGDRAGWSGAHCVHSQYMYSFPVVCNHAAAPQLGCCQLVVCANSVHQGLFNACSTSCK